MEQKPITRRAVLSRRDLLPDAVRAAASEAIGDAVAALLERLAAGSIVALYAPKGTEVATAHLDGLVRARGLRVVYPRIVDRDRRLAFHEVGVGELVPSRFGLREPRADAATVETAAIDVFVIPGLAFDRAGWRIGWGRGYYDATLAGAPAARRIGVAFDCQIVDSVPHDVHDARMHTVVTETNVFTGEVA
jgi:5-formyltetrahydrofolate cyclo-ligase